MVSYFSMVKLKVQFLYLYTVTIEYLDGDFDFNSFCKHFQCLLNIVEPGTY